MKYIVIILLTLIILRIDMFIGVVERVWDKVPKSRPTPPAETIETPAVSTFSVSGLQDDQISQFRLLMTEFSYAPDKLTRELVVNYLKNHPQVAEISESALFFELDKWTPLSGEDNPEVPLILNDLMGVFKGKQLQTIQQFYSNILVANTELFFHYYPLSRDPNCMVAKYAWNNQNKLTMEDIKSRQGLIEETSVKLDPHKIDFASGCQLVLRVEKNKFSEPSEQP